MVSLGGNAQNIILFGGLMGSFTVALVAIMLIPPPYGNVVGGVLYFTVLILVFGLGKWSTQLKYSPYPHFEFTTRPRDDNFNFFADNQSQFLVDKGGEVGTALLHTPFKTWIPGFDGKKSKLALYYKGKLYDRVELHARDIIVGGFGFSHPHSGVLIVKPAPRGGCYLDHGEEIPTFELVNGNKDRESTYASVESKIKVGEKEIVVASGKLEKDLEEKDKIISDLRSQLGETTKKMHKLEDENFQQRGVLSGVLEGTSAMKKAVVQFFMPIYMAEGTFEKALKHFTPPSMEKFWKYILIGVVAIIFIVYLWKNPQVVAGLQQWANNPVVVAGVVIFSIAVVFIALRLRRRS